MMEDETKTPPNENTIVGGKQITSKVTIKISTQAMIINIEPFKRTLTKPISPMPSQRNYKLLVESLTTTNDIA